MLVVPSPYPPPEGESAELQEIDPCRYLPFSSRWNSDAAAASAVEVFLEAAAILNEPGLYNREFGVYGVRGPMGRTVLKVVGWGDAVLRPDGTQNPDGTGVDIPAGGVTGFNITAIIHNHPSGEPLLSGADWGLFDYWKAQMLAVNRPASQLTMYIIVAVNTPQGPGYRVYAFNEEDRGGATPPPLKEVNPDAAPCPP